MSLLSCRYGTNANNQHNTLSGNWRSAELLSKGGRANVGYESFRSLAAKTILKDVSDLSLRI